MRKKLKIIFPIASAVIILSLIVIMTNSNPTTISTENNLEELEAILFNEGDVLSIQDQEKDVIVSFLAYENGIVNLMENTNVIDTINVREIIGESNVIKKKDSFFFIGENSIANIYLNTSENTLGVDILGNIKDTNIKDIDKSEDKWFLLYDDKIEIREGSSFEEIDIKLDNIEYKDGFIYGTNNVELLKISVENKNIEKTKSFDVLDFMIFGNNVVTVSKVDDLSALILYDIYSLTPLDILDIKTTNAKILGVSNQVIYVMDKDNLLIKTVDLNEFKPLKAYDISAEVEDVEEILDVNIQNSIVSVVKNDNIINYSLLEKNKIILSNIAFDRRYEDANVVSIQSHVFTKN